MKKEQIVSIMLNVVLTIFIVVGYNQLVVSEQQDEIETIVEEQIAGLNLNVEEKIKKIDILEKRVEKLENDVNDIKNYLKIITKKMKEQIKIKRDNIFITESMRKLLSEIEEKIKKEEMENNEEFNKNIRNKLNFKQNVLNEEKNEETEKKDKKKKKIVKYHLNIPSLYKVKRIEKINNKVYLYLANGEVLTKNITYNGLYILDIDLNNNYILAKVVEKNSYEYGKVVKIPFLLIFDNYTNEKENEEKLKF